MWDYGDGNRGPQMAAVAIVMTCLSVVSVALRSYTMATILKRFLVEDWLAVFTCLLQCAFCTLVLLGTSHGLGAHVANVPPDERPKALVYKWAGQVAYIVVSTFVKLVVGIFLLRLCVSNRWQRITILVLLVIVGLFNLFYVFIAVFQCQPIAFYWYRYTADPPVTGKCNNHALATIPTYFAVLIGIASDLTLALLPITLIKGANLDNKTKISVCCVLALGSLASVATVARIPYARQLLSDPDYLYNFTDLAIWSIVECGIAITASSLATLRPLFIQMKLLTTNFTSRFGNSSMSKGMSSGLPTYSRNTVTFVSSRPHTKESHRFTLMTTTTATTVMSGGLASVKEVQEGIHVEKGFEMCVITRENSADSIDRLEAEINEVIRPGTAKRNASRDRSMRSASGSLTARPKLPAIQTSFQEPMPKTPSTAITGSAVSPSTPEPGQIAYAIQQSVGMLPSMGSLRKGSFGQPALTPQNSTAATFGSAYADTLRSPPMIFAQPPRIGHESTNSDGSIRRPRTPQSPAPSFHLPTRMQHRSRASSVGSPSGASRGSRSNRGTFGAASGILPPADAIGLSQEAYTPTTINTTFTSQPDDDSYFHRHRSSNSLGAYPIIITPGSPTTNLRPTFQKSNTILETSEKNKRSKPRVSGFLADNSSISSAGDGREDDDKEEMEGTHWTQPSQGEPSQGEATSPLRSRPPPSPLGGNWI